MATLTNAEWAQAREALADAVARVTGLLRTVTTPDAPALGAWSVAEVAMHLSQAWIVVPGLAAQDPTGMYEVIPRREGVVDESLVPTIAELADATVLGVRSDPERDLAVLADRIEQRAAAFLADPPGEAQGEHRTWLVEGSAVSLPTLTCHLLNETLVHGYDIARAAGKPWTIGPAHAALVIAGFIVPVFQALDPAAMVTEGRGRRARATFDLRIRGGRSFHFVFADGGLHIEDPSPPRRVDCHISADPVAFLLVAWGRRSQWAAIARGQLVTWGRKPWLGPQLRWFIRTV